MNTRDTPARIGGLPPLGQPATRALLKAGITTLTQVAAHSPQELLALHGVGPKAIRLLHAALAEHGLTFGQTTP
ncbi:hypothetical protein JHV56_06440 [Arthrobacter sp. BHU FT2]|nr:hypothetical protein [Arthrobacter sp. BHU FT2]